MSEEALNPNQLKMFMSAREIKEQYSTHIGDRAYTKSVGPNTEQAWRTDEETWQRKAFENRSVTGRAPMAADIRLNGVQFPVGLGTDTDTEVVSGFNKKVGPSQQIPEHAMTGKPMITAGHHRIQAQYEADPERLIPVIHHSNILEAQGWAGHVPESHRDPKTGVIAKPWGHYR